jgi:hypothetical protein
METKKEVETKKALNTVAENEGLFWVAVATAYLIEMEHLQEEDEDWCSFNEYVKSFQYDV